MESSFLEDLLTKDVDETAVSALVGSLESQLTSSSRTANASGSRSTSNVNILKDGTRVTNTSDTGSKSNMDIRPGSRTSAPNGSVIQPSSVNAQVTHTSANITKPDLNSRQTVPVRSTGASPNTINVNTPGSQVNIIPKSMISNTVPIAPRIPTTIMITPQQAQLLMAQRLTGGATLVPSNILGNVRMAGGQVPLSRLTAPNNTTGMPVSMLQGQMAGMPAIAPRLAIPPGQLNAHGVKPGQSVSPAYSQQQVTVKQEPGRIIKQETLPKHTIVMQSGLTTTSQTNSMPATTLTQVKGTSSPIPGVVTYRFRQVTPASIAGGTPSPPVNVGQLMKESVKKLKEFFQNLISLACGPNQPPEIGRSVKELVQNVMCLAFVAKLYLSPHFPRLEAIKSISMPPLSGCMRQKEDNMQRCAFMNRKHPAGCLLRTQQWHGKLTEEQFVEKLQMTLKSDPQPNLVPFLKKTLPHLRETISQQQKMMQQQQTQAKVLGRNKLHTSQTGISRSSSDPHSLNIRASAPSRTPPNQPIPVPGLHAAGPNAVIHKGIPVSQMSHYQIKNVTAHHQQQQPLVSKRISPGGRVVVVTSANFNKGATIAPTNVVTSKTAAQTLADKAKAKSSFHYSSALTSNDDDINDVTCMAGVNLMEESAKILSSGTDILSSQTRSCKDESFLPTDALSLRIREVAKRRKIVDIHQDAVSVVSHAVQERLRNILERLCTCSMHRVESHKVCKTSRSSTAVYLNCQPPFHVSLVMESTAELPNQEHSRFDITSDVKTQLKVFEQIDEVERKHREAREREMLMRVAKSRSRTEDPEQARLKEKAKQLQQEEEEILRKRAANRTALEAIGPRKKRKLDEALESLQGGQGGNSSSGLESSLSSSSLQSQSSRPRTRRIMMKDLQFVMEQDKETSKSLALYKSFLR